jgi:hypothetical protein
MEYPLHEGDIRNEHPEIREDQTWPNFPCPPTYALVEWVDPPLVDPPLEYCYEGNPELVDNKWRMNWQIGKFTQEEWDNILAENDKIKESLKQQQAIANTSEDLAKPGSVPDVIG